jgi:hypothetical protein
MNTVMNLSVLTPWSWFSLAFLSCQFYLCIKIPSLITPLFSLYFLLLGNAFCAFLFYQTNIALFTLLR